MLESLNNYWNSMLPEQVSTWAAQVDWINALINNISLLSIVLITGAMLYFCVKYRKRTDNDVTCQISHDTRIETVWTVVPTIICLFMFYYGVVQYDEMRTPPANAIEINVEGYKWGWNYRHPSGKKDAKDLVVPVGKPVRLLMRSRDVLHSFFIPAMRVKEDVAANRYSYLWFTAEKEGKYPIFCAEYCGTSHSGMLGELTVVSAQEYQDYLSGRKLGEAADIPPEKLGELAYNKNGCMACHSLSGARVVGPSFKGLWGSERSFVEGEAVIADENYIKESIWYPNKLIVAGYPPNQMPAYKDQISEEDIDNLIAFMKTLK